MSSERFELATSPTVSDNDDAGCFDCNICLELACDPVVTTCGHLYCWPCICRWSHAQNNDTPCMALTVQHDRRMIDCPVCRNVIDTDLSLIPLYIPLRSSHVMPSRAAFSANIESNPCFCPATGIGRRRNDQWRREEQKLETSLNRVSVFLIFCAVMCLLML